MKFVKKINSYFYVMLVTCLLSVLFTNSYNSSNSSKSVFALKNTESGNSKIQFNKTNSYKHSVIVLNSDIDIDIEDSFETELNDCCQNQISFDFSFSQNYIFPKNAQSNIFTDSDYHFLKIPYFILYSSLKLFFI